MANDTDRITTTCSACHRPLTDPVSVGIGMGSVCRRRLGAAELGEKGSYFSDHATRSAWSFVVDGNFIMVTDHDKGMSVTNDAANVIAELARRTSLDRRRVLYCDTTGRWDELRVVPSPAGPRFGGFQPIGAAGYQEAIAMASGDNVSGLPLFDSAR